ncbi:PLP-dependent aminotransferase family protein [Methylophilus sp. 14]|uniref:MocR-like pyridoxine biosynthesis transcription factor PdxR n=1 Tax=Methylophilus sp. 14 TaxID=2781019 RepID=UPI00188E70B3|nr:PLP-dependent aminotransferase family protein [Methylophilus sp. 14]MBF4986675.1 PLP-dependent aminotransferase family protein [Methylophilus sp. 14]
MTASTHDSWLHIDKSRDEPIHAQIYNRFKQAIESGALNHGDRVPSTRVLASTLNVARGTVENAYAMLLGEGIFNARGQAGCYINAPYKQTAVLVTAGSRKPAAQPALLATANSPPSHVFLPGSPAYDAFPRKIWSRLASRRARSLSATELSFRDPFGYLPLRQSIAAYLRLSRGVVCDAHQICITHGYQGALDFLLKCLPMQHQEVWMEDPAYLFAARAIDAAGAKRIPVPVDHEGLVISEGILRAPRAALAIVTPSHQSPLGMALSWSRRMQLLDWAGKAEAWVVEDDYDGEFRYSGYPLPSLKSLDQYDRVIYAGSFSKTLFPALRLGYLVLPQPLVALCQQKAQLFQPGGAIGPQLIVNDFMAEGYFSKHLKKMRALYAERREITRQTLVDHLAPHLEINTHKNGMHFVANIISPHADHVIADQFNRYGYGIHALSRWSASSSHNGLIIGFTNVPNRATAEHATQQLLACFQQLS